MKAFPWTGVGTDGMDLRDYFAAKIISSLLNNEAIIENADEQDLPFPIYISVLAYDIADAMIEIRKTKMED